MTFIDPWLLIRCVAAGFALGEVAAFVTGGPLMLGAWLGMGAGVLSAYGWDAVVGGQ